MLLDTNILLRYSQPSDPLHLFIFQYVQKMIYDEKELYVTSQNLIEAYRVATRPEDKNGFGMSSSAAIALLENLENIFIRSGVSRSSDSAFLERRFTIVGSWLFCGRTM
jgi:predicted nucleic acid-binding protein